MAKRVLILLIASLFLGFEGCGQTDRVERKDYDLMLQSVLEERIPFLSVDSLAEMDPESYILLDTRSRAEQQVSMIPGAVWVGPEFDPQGSPKIPKDKVVVTYCSVGKRSEDYGAALAANKDVKVLNLYGGIFEWVNQGHPVEKDGKRTRKVHAYDRTWGVWLRKGKKVYRPEPGGKE